MASRRAFVHDGARWRDRRTLPHRGRIPTGPILMVRIPNAACWSAFEGAAAPPSARCSPARRPGSAAGRGAACRPGLATGSTPATSSRTPCTAHSSGSRTSARRTPRRCASTCGVPSPAVLRGRGAAASTDSRRRGLGALPGGSEAPGAAPLARTSAIVHMLESAAGPLRVHPADPSSFFKLLPPDEAAWVVETAADAVVPVARAGRRTARDAGRRPPVRRPARAARRPPQALGAGAGLALGTAVADGPRGRFPRRRPPPPRRVPRVRMRGRGGRGAGMRLRVRVCRGRGPGVADSRPPARARCRRQRP